MVQCLINNYLHHQTDQLSGFHFQHSMRFQPIWQHIADKLAHVSAEAPLQLKVWNKEPGPSYSHFFSKKFQNICVSLFVNFNESLTNDIISFEQLGPDHTSEMYMLTGTVTFCMFLDLAFFAAHSINELQPWENVPSHISLNYMSTQKGHLSQNGPLDER